MTFQDIPTIFEILNKENLKPVPVLLEGDKIVCEDANGNKFLMKDCRGIERKVFESVLPAIEGQNLSFNTLQLPKHRNIVSVQITENGAQKQRDFIFINYYEGITFNSTWNETSPEGYGGRGIGNGIAEKAINLLENFSLVDVTSLSTFGLPTFDLANWKSQNLPLKAENLIKRGVVNKAQVDKAISILSSPSLFQNSPMIITNGDFYPRNFIELKSGKIVVIDWEGREDYHASIEINGSVQNFTSQRNALINYIENHAAFFFVHMWGNYPVQREFMKKVTTKFHLSPKNLQASIIIKSLEQSLAFGGGYLAVREAELFVNALEIDFINDLIA